MPNIQNSYKKLIIFGVLLWIVLIGFSTKIYAATGINTQINFQGKLLDDDGLNVPDADYDVVFTLYDAASSGTTLWDETQTVSTVDGVFNVALGSVDTSLANVDFNSDSLYLGINVENDGEMDPRIRFTASPYAMNARKVGNVTVDNTSGNTFAFKDKNGNEMAIMVGVSSAVNELTITSAATGNGVAIAATGGDTNVDLKVDSKGSGALNLNNTATGNVNIAGGSGATGCTIDNSNGNLTCSGTISGSGAVGYWTRSGTTLSPATSGDNIATTGNVAIGTTAAASSKFEILNGGGSSSILFSSYTGSIFHAHDLTHSNELLTLTNTNGGGRFHFAYRYVTMSQSLGIADTSPDYSLEIGAASSADSSFALSDGDVAHGLTTLGETDAWLSLKPISSTAGGTKLEAFSDTDAAALNIYGYIGSTDPTDTTAAIKLVGAKKNTTGVQDLGALETVFQVANNDDTAALTILGNGNMGIGTTAPASSLQIASGQIRVPNGTLSAPSYSFSNSTSTGFFQDSNDIYVAANGVQAYRLSNTSTTGLQLHGSYVLSWGTGIAGTAEDLVLLKDASNTLGQRNGTNAQTFNIYNTYSGGGSNYERLSLGYSSNLIAFNSNAAGTGTARNFNFTGGNVAIGTSPSTTVVSDTFTRADSASSIGTSTSGHSWTVTGTWGISSNQAYHPAGGTSQDTAYIDSGIYDGTVQVTLATLPATNPAGLLFRLSDTSNYLYVETQNATTYRLNKLVAGSATVLATVSQSPANGDVLKVTFAGSTIQFYINNVLKSTVTDSFNQTATKHGIHDRFFDTAARFDDFSVTNPWIVATNATPNLSIYGAASQTVDFFQAHSSTGTTMSSITAAGGAYFAGNVGVGTSVPGYNLETSSTALNLAKFASTTGTRASNLTVTTSGTLNGNLTLTHTNAATFTNRLLFNGEGVSGIPEGGAYLQGFNRAGLAFGSSTPTFLVYGNENGYVSIGNNTNPQTRLDVTGLTIDSSATDGRVAAGLFTGTFTKNDTDNQTFPVVRIKPVLNTGASNTTTTINILDIDTTNTAVTGLTTNLINASYGGTSRFIVTSGGNIGIGTTAPPAPLGIFVNNNSSTNYLRFRDSNTGSSNDNDTGIDVYSDSSGQYMMLGANLYYNGDSTPTRFESGIASAGIEIKSRSSTGALNFYTGTTSADPTTPRMAIQTDGNIVVGASSVNAPTAWERIFQVSDATRAVLSLRDSGDNGQFDLVNNGSTLGFYDAVNAGYRMYINTSGNVGIGTTTTPAMLTIGGTADLSFRNATSFSSAGDDMSMISLGDNYGLNQARLLVERGAAGAGGDNPTDISFWNTPDGSTTLTERMRIKYDGNVGIGTSNPSTKLEVYGGVLTVTDTNNFYVTPNYGGSGDIPAGILFSTAGTNGNIGIIGHGAGTAGQKVAGIAYSGSNWRSMWEFAHTNGTEPNLLLVKNAGNVGIGTSAPSGALVDINHGTNALRLRAGNSAANFTSNQILMSYQSTNTYSHAIRTRHHSNQMPENAIDFYTWNFGVDSSTTAGTKHNLTLDGGNIGIGTTSPVYKTSIISSISSADTAVAAITNNNSTDSSNTTALRLNVGVGTTTTNARFIRFYANVTSGETGGTAVGNIKMNNNAVAYTTSGADFAEYADMAEPVSYGDIIATTSRGNVKATENTPLIGVVSDTAGFIGNAKTDDPLANQAIMGFVGHIKTKVSTINGPIRVGDPIAASSIPGVGKKASAAGYIIGKALENYDNPDPNAVKRIQVMVTVSWYDPAIVLNELGEMVGSLQDTVQNTSNTTSSLSSQINSTTLTLASVDTRIQTLENKYQELAAQLASLSSTQIATQSADLSAINASLASLTTQTSTNTNRITTLEEELATLRTQLANASSDLAASNSATIASTSALLAEKEATLAALMVTGKSNLNDVSIMGRLTTGLLSIDGLSGGAVTISSLGVPLKIQDTISANIEFQGAQIVMDTKGNIVANEITIKKINIDTTDTASATLGSATIEAGETEVVINTTNVTKDSKIFTSITSALDSPITLIGISKKEGESFTIQMVGTNSKDIDFDWWIVN